MADRRRDAHHRRCEVDVALRAVKADGDAALGLDAFELLQEIDVEVGAPEFAVGDALEAEILLEADDVSDGGVFDGAQPHAIDLAALEAVARLQELRRSQEAADVIGAKRGFGANGHVAGPHRWKVNFIIRAVANDAGRGVRVSQSVRVDLVRHAANAAAPVKLAKRLSRCANAGAPPHCS